MSFKKRQMTNEIRHLKCIWCMKSFSTARRLKIWLRNNDARAIYQPDNIKQSTERTDDFEDVANEFADRNCKYQPLPQFFYFFR